MASALITYLPLPDEPDWRDHPGLAMLEVAATVDQSPTQDPLVFAEKLSVVLKGEIMILVPGTRFDIQGTRVGRGGGWYDRFLSRVPSTWRRVGVLHASQLSKEVLIRKPLDVPVDALFITHDGRWIEINTHARD